MVCPLDGWICYSSGGLRNGTDLGDLLFLGLSKLGRFGLFFSCLWDFFGVFFGLYFALWVCVIGVCCYFVGVHWM